MVDRIVARIEESRLTSVEVARDMYYLYFRVDLYRKLYKGRVDEILTADGYADCMMTLDEINDKE
ncbi:hypothetical protein [Anaerosporobacter sp.]|uniref:hypothetical protein n=1 Tax=Anaerosporobacter sp. TaxID=1872529 RepID=UPI00286F5E07|nr:hypothetical protein [Anaerosporobacter sp.]